MVKATVVSGLLVLCQGCSTAGFNDGGLPPVSDAGGDGGSSSGTWRELSVDPAAGSQLPLAIAVGPSDQVGIAYFVALGTTTAGQDDLALTYAEVRQGQLAVAPARIATVQIQDGLSVAFLPDGTPLVGYVGGQNYVYHGPDAGATPTGSTYWLESQATMALRLADGGWQPQTCMYNSTADGGLIWKVFGADGEDASAEQLVNRGSVVGLWPSLLADPQGTVSMVFRDVHDGQFPIQDWAASDVKLCQGPLMGGQPAQWTYSAPMTIDRADDHKVGGFGVHNQSVFGPNGTLAIASASDPNDQGSLTTGSNRVFFVQRNLASHAGSTADWSLPLDPFDPTDTQPENQIMDTQSGPSLVYDPSFGYGIAVVDASQPTPPLYWISSTDGVNWTPKYALHQLGSGGYFPSAAVDPLSGNANVSFTICSGNPSVSPSPHGCSPVDAQIELATSNGSGGWNSAPVLKGNYFLPRLAFLHAGKPVIAFTDLDQGGLSVLIQQ